MLCKKEETSKYSHYTAADYIAATMAVDSTQAAGLFKTNSRGPGSPLSHPINQQPPLTKRSSFRRIASWLTGNSNNSVYTDDGSLADFQESEWTPPDSSYGAALPIFGWIPKKVRRLIELTLIGFMIILLVYLVVTTSIRVTEGNNNGNSSSSGGLSLNDDYYIEYSNSNNNNGDDANNAVDDDAGGGGQADDMYEYDYYGDAENNNNVANDDASYGNRRYLRLRFDR